MATFFGNFDQTIDAKRRLPITSYLREMIDPQRDGTNFVMLLWPDGHLRLYPDKYYLRLIAEMKRQSSSSAEYRKIALFFARGRILKADAQGRVVVPQKLMQEAHIGDEVTLVGADDRIELWLKDDWNTSKTVNTPENIDDIHHNAGKQLASDNAEKNNE